MAKDNNLVLLTCMLVSIICHGTVFTKNIGVDTELYANSITVFNCIILEILPVIWMPF